MAAAHDEASAAIAAASARTEQLHQVERQLREGLSAAANWLLQAANGERPSPLSLQPASNGTSA